MECAGNSADALGQSEIQHLRMAAGSDQDILRLEIAMHNARGVRRRQRVCYLCGDIEQA